MYSIFVSYVNEMKIYFSAVLDISVSFLLLRKPHMNNRTLYSHSLTIFNVYKTEFYTIIF